MATQFPEPLENKLLELIKPLQAFMVENKFVCRNEALDPAVAAAPDFDDSDWTALEKPTLRRDQGDTWLRLKFRVPEYCADIPIAGSQLRIETEGKGHIFAPLEFYIDGRCALAERSWMDFKSPEAIVSESAVPGATHTLALCFHLNEKCYWLNTVSLQVHSDRVDSAVNHVLSIIEELRYMERFDGAMPLCEQGWALMDAAADRGSVAGLVEAAQAVRGLFEGFRETVKRNRVSLVGHAHIDMNWFWSMEETRDIVRRDFTTMLHLMERYPDFKFSQSQCSTYQIAQEDAPELFEEIKRRAGEGRWDVTASTWVEGDLNMAEGESIVRHVLYAKAYLKDHFDHLPRIMWCPDTFGHPATIPQILKKSGIDFYYHTRCGEGVGSRKDHRNQAVMEDSFAYLQDSVQVPAFWWRGADGSRVLSYNTNYHRVINTRGILRASARMLDFGVPDAMLTYGVGDHGGGPTVRDIEWVNEMRRFPTTPDIRFATTEEYYAALAEGGYDLPEREGEMNFVFDGCYTTHADIKYQNRKCEMGLTGVEKLYALASAEGESYPRETLTVLWRKTLFNQFHDILDGSGVKDTYRFTRSEADDVLNGVDALSARAMAALAKRYGDGEGTGWLLYNPTGFLRAAVVPIEGAAGRMATGANGKRYPTQRVCDIVKVYVDDLPACGLMTISLKPGEAEGSQHSHIEDVGDYYVVSTPLLEAEIRKDNGQITSLYDKARDWYVVRREHIGWRLKKGVLNRFEVHMEEPTGMSGWTIGNVRTVHNLLDGAQSEIISDGCVETRLRFTHHFMKSTIVQDIVFNDFEPEIRFENRVDWREYGDFDRDAPMLKVYFAPDVQNTTVDCEIPFGVLSRPCVDAEIPALNWVDISDARHGFALMNDCKHGHRCRGNGLELTLIRSGWLPDQKSDVGEHAFTYAIRLHDAGWQEGRVIERAQALNRDVLAVHALGGEPCERSLADVDGAVPDAVKRAEDGQGTVLRLYNPGDTPITATVRPGMPFGEAFDTDLLEANRVPLTPVDGIIVMEMGPYDIRTLYLSDPA